MRYDVLTIFPEFFASVFSVGLISKAIEKGLIAINTHNIRDYSVSSNKSVDDRPYGGGSGMVLKPAPIVAALKEVKNQDMRSKTVLLSPSGEVFNDRIAMKLAEYDQLVFICGRYEGVDERIKDYYVDLDLSVGDYILSGGEYAAISIIDAVSRYIPNFLGNEYSNIEESFRNNLLEYPQYTRPEEFEGYKVPDVLLSGNHSEIKKWRRRKQIAATLKKRDDLIDRSKLNIDEIKELDAYKNQESKKFRLYIALIHYPVYNKRLEIVKTSFTNIDVLDIARASRTFGIKGFYLVHPVEEQKQLIKRVLDHWTEGKGYNYNSSRRESLEDVYLSDSFEDTISEIERIEGLRPKVIATDARYSNNMIGYDELKNKLQTDEYPYLILFGTGYGLSKEVIMSSDYILKPITGNNEYNHLSVRSAASIILDRLCSLKN